MPVGRAHDAAALQPTDFVSIASHELRAPIAVVHGIAATLHDRIDNLDEGQVHALLGTLVQEELLPRIAADRLDDVRVRVHGDCELVADAAAFERVAANLIVNALRYGEAPVEIRSENGDCFRLVVEDRGDGVDPDFVPHLFERFSRSDETRRAGVPGAGLGLSIASAYAASLGGTLEYEPAQPHGARFTLSLPAARS
jgi:signal transduction histidine kinase